MYKSFIKGHELYTLLARSVYEDDSLQQDLIGRDIACSCDHVPSFKGVIEDIYPIHQDGKSFHMGIRRDDGSFTSVDNYMIHSGYVAIAI